MVITSHHLSVRGFIGARLRLTVVFLFSLITEFYCFGLVVPSGTLPVIHINTENGTVIDQREFYIPAEAWIDASMKDNVESIGSEAKPVQLGIKGRGNSSWWSFPKKPYKMRFVKSVPLLGYNSSKHFALLHWLGSSTAYFREPLGYEAGRRLGDPWTPRVDAVEVVMNGEYIGLYFLSETVRVESTRVDITSQPDLMEEEGLIDSGWLVEIDNYEDAHQSILSEKDGRELRLTYHQPEILSDQQRTWIETNFYEFIEAVHSDDKSDARWLDLIDGESMARYYIVQEIMHNYDGCNGSFFLYRDKGTKWFAGPLWDLSYTLEQAATSSYLETLPKSSNPKLIREMLKYPEFHEIIRQVWEPFYRQGTAWIDKLAEEWIVKINKASLRDKEVWEFGSDHIEGRGRLAASILKSNIEWFNGYVYSEGFGKISSIEQSPVDRSCNEVVYDLSGRIVKNPGHGIYIVRTDDGRMKKVLL